MFVRETPSQTRHSQSPINFTLIGNPIYIIISENEQNKKKVYMHVHKFMQMFTIFIKKKNSPPHPGSFLALLITQKNYQQLANTQTKLEMPVKPYKW